MGRSIYAEAARGPRRCIRQTEVEGKLQVGMQADKLVLSHAGTMQDDRWKQRCTTVALTLTGQSWRASSLHGILLK